MSPEQARGEPSTAASDMYSLGLLLQEVFTGRPAYDETLDRAGLLRGAMQADTLAPAGLSADLTTLIQRLKSPAATNRPTAVETAERLRWIRQKATTAPEKPGGGDGAAGRHAGRTQVHGGPQQGAVHRSRTPEPGGGSHQLYAG